MSRILDQRCFHHASREAVVRCPECSRFFCRECVVEHRGRMICTECIIRQPGASDNEAAFTNVTWIAAALGGLLLAWLIFYNLGMMLARLTPDFLQ